MLLLLLGLEVEVTHGPQALWLGPNCGGHLSRCHPRLLLLLQQRQPPLLLLRHHLQLYPLWSNLRGGGQPAAAAAGV
jgi:hypothetical protein